MPSGGAAGSTSMSGGSAVIAGPLRGTTDALAVTVGQRLDRLFEDDEIPDWRCPACGFQNSGLLPHCERCVNLTVAASRLTVDPTVVPPTMAPQGVQDALVDPDPTYSANAMDQQVQRTASGPAAQPPRARSSSSAENSFGPSHRGFLLGPGPGRANALSPAEHTPQPRIARPSASLIEDVPESPSTERSLPNDVAPERRSTCVICLEAVANAAVIPCGHRCGCMRCLTSISAGAVGMWSDGPKCPICRGPVQSVVKIHDC